ncbi:hypothetical protein JD844_009891 [Phrynosoma platyrhinos]|uniref:Uncharacterized protein n=1 Tax=Phrynosoma platyrhinos TaxID=52577 RepID=A0ABQ7TG70_PHRPL|nr:hypothetical protein JD844_009891 [Phrynosoma platyrhinos]
MMSYKLKGEKKEGNLKTSLEKQEDEPWERRQGDFAGKDGSTKGIRLEEAKSRAGQTCGLQKEIVHLQIIKPLMEKKRRNRIAHSLNQLKTLLVDVPIQGNKPLLILCMASLEKDMAEDRGFWTRSSYCASFVQATISERQQYPEPSNQSSPNYETFSLVTPPSASGLEKISSWNEKLEAFSSFPFSERPVPSMVLSRTGSQVFWRPWST